MAQRVNIVLEDDLDKSSADETVNFGIDGVNYEIDLSSANAAALRQALSVYMAHGRKVGSARAKAAAPGRRNRRSAGVDSPNDIRAWALAQGMQVNSRGRVPAEIRAAYEAAH